MTTDNGVLGRAHELGRRHGRQLIAVTTAAALFHFVHITSTGPARFAAIVGAVLLVGLAVVDPHLGRRRTPPRVLPPVPPDNPTDEYAYLAYLESLILDTRAEMDERDDVIDTVLAGLQSSASGVAYTAGRLRRRLDRTISHTS